MTIMGTAAAQEATPDVDIAQQDKDIPSLSVGSSVINRNMFFGMNFGNIYMAQPFIEGSYKNLTFGTWGNFDTKDMQFIENDWYASYTKPFALDSTHSISPRVDIAWYTFPHSDTKDVQHTAIGLSTEGFWGDYFAKLSKVYNSGGEGWLFQTGASKTVSLTENVSATLAATATYNKEYFSTATGWSHVDVTGSLSWEPADGWSVAASYTRQESLDTDFSPESLGDEIGSVTDLGYGQISVSRTF